MDVLLPRPQLPPRRQPREGQLRVLVGQERFSENHAWSEMPQHWPSYIADRAVIEVVGQGRLEARLVDGGSPVDVVVPMWSPLPGRAIRAGRFGGGLIGEVAQPLLVQKREPAPL